MSARTPFVPGGSRPASRAAHAQEQDHNSKATPQFTADLSNPLHAPSNASVRSLSNAEPSTQSNKNNTLASAAGTGTRPLNTSGLLKKSTGARHQTASRRPTIVENASLRPDTADPNSHVHQDQNQNYQPTRNQMSNIIAPMPRQAPRPSSPTLSANIASGVFATSTSQTVFRMPALPPPPTLPTNSNIQPETDAHISASALGFSFAKPHSTTEKQQFQLPSPPTSVRTSSARVFESHVSVETENLPPQFTLNMSAPNQTGPQRVLINPDQLINADEDRSTLNRSNPNLKRPRAEFNDETKLQDHADDYGSHSKRYKNRSDGYSDRTKSITSHPSSPVALSVRSHSRSRTPEAMSHDPRSYRSHHHQHRPQESYHRQPEVLTSDTLRPLDKLLGCNVDGYVEDHADQYERALGRWKHCTMEEWIAGAEEQAARYTKILEFVKDHMTTKMKLFASFDATVDAHSVVLEEREKVLDTAKGRLVHESANVLGNGRQ